MRKGLSFLLLLGSLLPGSAPAAEAREQGEVQHPFAVVVHSSVPVDSLDVVELREIILGERKFWGAGLRVELVVEAASGPARRLFVEELSGMSEFQFQRYWTGLIFSNRATRPPRAAPDRRTVLALVSAIPGAMGLVEAGQIPDQVKVLHVEGLPVASVGKNTP